MKKRKDFELDFPPTKSRRLDCELYGTTTTTTTMEEDPNLMPKQSNEERALVLYDPSSNIPLIKSPTSPPLSIVINTDLIPGLKDYLLSRDSAMLDELGEDGARRERSSEVSKDCLAVIPWVASHSPMACEEIVPETGQPLELEEEGGEMMEMDEPHINDNNEKAMEIVEKVEAVGASSPWQQQHCMMPNMLQKTTTPIRWC